MSQTVRRAGEGRQQTPPRRPRPARRIVLLLLVIVAIFASVGAARFVQGEESDASLVPRLALDLEGGVQIVLTPRLDPDAEGDASDITTDDVNQAIEIIRQRVDASGVAEAEITRQGQGNIVVGIPGDPDEATLDLVRRSAQMRFRSVLAVCNPTPIADGTPYDVIGGGMVSCEEIAGEHGPFAEVDEPAELDDVPATTPTDGSDLAWITQRVAYDVATLDCTLADNRIGGILDDPDAPLVTCDEEGLAKYVLGPVEIEGTQLSRATSGFDSTRGRWIVNLEFDSTGREIFGELSQRLYNLSGARNQFASVLDGLVVVAPGMEQPIYDGRAMISGTFSSDDVATLANQLNFGSLPLNFEVQSQEQISATLGTEQLRNGIIAGAVGLGLVALYLLWQYRAISIVAVLSLVVASVGTYGAIILLGWVQGYRLSLAGVAGIIVSIGITADSFILYFERIRDEVREGRSLAGAIEHGWARAKRTIIIADIVTLLAAVVLYFLAVGGVRGFAFTLGLTTLIDLVVAFVFTQPLVQLLSRTRFFGGGHKLSGFDALTLGAKSPSYVGRGRVRTPEDRAEVKKAPATARRKKAEPERDGAHRQTIAERRAAERRAAANSAASGASSGEPAATDSDDTGGSR